jgi:hypothetical protein
MSNSGWQAMVDALAKRQLERELDAFRKLQDMVAKHSEGMGTVRIKLPCVDHEWVDTGFKKTWCKHCDQEGLWEAGEVQLVSKPASEEPEPQEQDEQETEHDYSSLSSFSLGHGLAVPSSPAPAQPRQRSILRLTSSGRVPVRQTWIDSETVGGGYWKGDDGTIEYNGHTYYTNIGGQDSPAPAPGPSDICNQSSGEFAEACAVAGNQCGKDSARMQIIEGLLQAGFIPLSSVGEILDASPLYDALLCSEGNTDSAGDSDAGEQFDHGRYWSDWGPRSVPVPSSDGQAVRPGPAQASVGPGLPGVGLLHADANEAYALRFYPEKLELLAQHDNISPYSLRNICI